VLLAGIGSCAFGAPACADAEPDSETWAVDRVGVSLGSYRNDLNLNASGERRDRRHRDRARRYRHRFRPGLRLGGSHQLVIADAFWRPFEHHQFSLGYLSDTRRQSRRLQRDIVFNGDTFPVGREVRARFQYQLVDARYTWWPVLTRQDAFGTHARVVAYRLELGLSEKPRSAEWARRKPNPPAWTATCRRRCSVSTTATPSTRTGACSPTSLAFKASINAIDGRVASANLGLEYYPWRRVGFARSTPGMSWSGRGAAWIRGAPETALVGLPAAVAPAGLNLTPDGGRPRSRPVITLAAPVGRRERRMHWVTALIGAFFGASLAEAGTSFLGRWSDLRWVGTSGATQMEREAQGARGQAGEARGTRRRRSPTRDTGSGIAPAPLPAVAPAAEAARPPPFGGQRPPASEAVTPRVSEAVVPPAAASVSRRRPTAPSPPPGRAAARAAGAGVPAAQWQRPPQGPSAGERLLGSIKS
jgi:hypothetical protein